MAKKKLTAKEADAYYAAMRDAKVAAGLPLDTATEVTARQRAEDEANKVEIEIDTDEPEKPAGDGKEDPKKA